MQSLTRPRPITLSTSKKVLFGSVVVWAFLILGYGGWTLLVSARQYWHLKHEDRGWRGEIHQPDAQLGYAAVPDRNGFHTFAAREDVPMRYDRHGFRVPVGIEDATRGPRPHILTLGCSYTYGDVCTAEETFAWQAAQRVGGTALNAGKCSYSLAHMLILGRELIARHQPDVVIVQYSPWLLDRAMTYYLPAYYGRMPGPYFAMSQTGQIEVRPPVFDWYAPDFSSYRTTPAGWRDFLSFAARGAVPLKLHDDFGHARSSLARALGLIPAPCRDREAIATAAYQELRGLCQATGVPMIIVVMGMDEKPVDVPQGVLDLGVPIVRGDELLRDQLAEPTLAAYRQAYAHWHGEPPVLLDTHPNPRAHTLVGGALADTLQQVPEIARCKDKGDAK